MAKYLLQASYTTEGSRGALKEGGTSRRAAFQRSVESAGGKLEAYYYGFGSEDVYAITEYPDNVAAAAVSMTVAASGAARVTTVVLITPEEIDQASKVRVSYRSPGAAQDVFRKV